MGNYNRLLPDDDLFEIGQEKSRDNKSILDLRSSLPLANGASPEVIATIAFEQEDEEEVKRALLIGTMIDLLRN